MPLKGIACKSVLLLIAALVTAWIDVATCQTKAMFADPNLERAVRNTLNKPAGELTTEDLSRLTSLNASGCGIETLSGLEAATNLVTLDVEINRIANLTPLASLLQLTSLNISWNSVRDVAPLSGLPNLSGLFLNGNSLETLAPLVQMTRLDQLGLRETHISDLAPLRALTNLRTLELDKNPIESLAPLCGLTNLSYLSANGMSFTNTGCFSCFTNLFTLWIGGNGIVDPSPLLNLTNLINLDLDQNPIKDAYSLAGFTNLSSLSVSGASLSNLNWVAGLGGLTSLTLAGNVISDISPLGGLTNLSLLDISENPLTNYSTLRCLPLLENLYLEANSIIDLSFVTNVVQVKGLSLGRNRIADLTPVAGLTNLLWFNVALNLVTNISGLEGMTNLQSVELSENLLNLTDGSKEMDVIETLQRNGASVYYQPQLEPPQILVRPQWVLPAGQRSWLTFLIMDGAYPWVQPPIVSARSPDPELNPGTVFATNHRIAYDSWDLAVTPAVDKAGPGTLIIAATNYAGLWTNIAIQIEVVPSVAFDGAPLDAPDLTWSSAGTPGWFGQHAISYDGVGAAQSGADNSSLQTTVTGPGILRFWFKLESDYYYASGQLSAISQDSNLHGYEYLHRAGERWQQQVLSLPAGEWVVKWSPSWDNWSFGGSNTLWLDQIRFTPGPPAGWLEPTPYEVNGARELILRGALGQTYEIQVSADLRNWSPLTQVTCENLETGFGDWQLSAPARFYRARLVR